MIPDMKLAVRLRTSIYKIITNVIMKDDQITINFSKMTTIFRTPFPIDSSPYCLKVHLDVPWTRQTPSLPSGSVLSRTERNTPKYIPQSRQEIRTKAAYPGISSSKRNPCMHYWKRVVERRSSLQEDVNHRRKAKNCPPISLL